MIESIRVPAAIVAVSVALTTACQSPAGDGISGTVLAGGQPVADATVTLWKTAGEDGPTSLAEATTDASGGFAIRSGRAGGGGDVYYLTTSGGAADGAAGDADPARPTSTWGGGDGIVVIYGVAAPVKTPLMGQVQRP